MIDQSLSNMWFSIGGPTAVGKTSFALFVAEAVLAKGLVEGVDLVSADSRQVYQGLEIVSGVDIPTDFEAENSSDHRTYVSRKLPIRLWGVSILKPDLDWSVAHFQKLALPIIEAAEKTKRLVIVVGGTGLYQQQILQVDPVLHIGPNQEIREQAELMSLVELQEWLKKVDAAKWAKMNHSDRSNPRRLVRAIEVGLAQLTSNTVSETVPVIPPSLGTLCLEDSLETIEAHIEQRVEARLANGAQAEVERLLAEYPNQKLPIFSATGVKVLAALSLGEIDIETAQGLWIKQERQYAKRQLTWYKKQPEVTWFNVHQPRWRESALEIITAWLVSE